MKVKEIIIEWLKANGYDGLYEPGECGCLIDDLAPCGSECVLHCQAGVKKEPLKGSEFDFVVGAKENK